MHSVPLDNQRGIKSSDVVDKIGDKQQFWENMTWRQRFSFVDIILYYFEKERIHLNTACCLRKARCHASAVACLTLSPPLFTRSVPMIHHVTRSLDFGRNITAFISWPLFCWQLSPSGWNLTRHVDKEICPRRRHFLNLCQLRNRKAVTQYILLAFIYNDRKIAQNEIWETVERKLTCDNSRCRAGHDSMRHAQQTDWRGC